MKRIETEFTNMIDVDYPIIGAPMFLLSYEELVVAVAEAGGLGTFPLPNFRTVEDLKCCLKKIREKTDKPIGVNIHLSGRFPWQEPLALCLDAGVKLFITSLGDPRLILDDVHANGGKVFADVISLEQGLKARDRGVDGLIAVASGAGGHGGTIPTFVLVPYLKSKTRLPTIAAGGISTGAQMAAAIALGACAVITGTRLIATTEARATDAYKKAVIEAGPEDIVNSKSVTGYRANWLSKSIEEFEKLPERWSQKWVKAWRDLWSAGQSVAQTEELKPAGEVVHEMVAEFIKTCKRLEASFPN
jgi:nitronate monooxygenase